ncbi:20337_t:CDS:2, partial [Entrophospora sp. SA101]
MACVTAANFGLVGNGRLFIINTGVGPNGIDLEKFYDTQDGLFDCCWSELNEHQIVTASGDGSIKLWDITLMEFPIMNWHEHSREVFSVNWNLIKKDCFISGSWDSSIKLWRPELRQSILTYNEHTNCVYSTIWSPYNPDIFGPVSGDQLMKIWDTKVPTKSVQTIHGHLEVMCLMGHEYAVRRVKCSPHDGNIIGSVSYDMTMKLWNTSLSNPLIEVYDAHTEFVLGLDFNLYVEGQIATCAWDEHIHILQPPALTRKSF